MNRTPQGGTFSNRSFDHRKRTDSPAASENAPRWDQGDGGRFSGSTAQAAKGFAAIYRQKTSTAGGLGNSAIESPPKPPIVPARVVEKGAERHAPVAQVDRAWDF